MLTVQAIRDRLRGQVALTLGVADPPWYLSAHAAEDMEDAVGRAKDGALRLHRSYAIAAPSTTYGEGRSGGRGRAMGMAATTEILVRWLYRLRVEAHDEDYSDALAAEGDLLRTLLRTPTEPGLIIAVGGTATRRVLRPVSGPLLMGDLPIRVHHFLDMGG